jgi:hypothetical protein
MKKQSTLIFALIICCSAALCQAPAITMTTKLPVGTDFQFILEGSNQLIQVDFGDGNKIGYYISTAPFTGNPWWFTFPSQNLIIGAISGTQPIKIYGEGITALICNGDHWFQTYSDTITGLDVSNCTTLKWLDCSNNPLGTVDVTKNIDLGVLLCYWNQLNTLDISQNTALWFLDCEANTISNLDISKNIALVELLCSNNQLTSIDVTKHTSLTSLYCGYNKLTSLDVSQNTVLGTLECSANQLSNLDVSKQTTALGVLACGSNKLTSLDVSQNTQMWKLFCYDNKLTNLDVSKDTALHILNCSGNPITSLDVSHTSSLTSLNCNACQLTSLDVGHNSSLTGLSCAYNQLTSLDVSKSPSLMTLRCPDNLLTSLELSANTILYELDCSNNLLSSIDVTHNTGLVLLYCWNNKLTSMAVNASLGIAICMNNQLTFATLPISGSIIGAPQAPIQIEKTLNAGVELDLSDQLTVNGNTTVYTWKTTNGDTLVQGTDYSLIDGKTIFLKAQADSVYCEMTNATFPLFTGDDVLKTTLTKVKASDGIVNANATGIQIYTQGKTVIIVSPDNGQASVYDINGRLVIDKEVIVGTNTIVLPNGGVYLVRLSGNNMPAIKKVFAWD